MHPPPSTLRHPSSRRRPRRRGFTLIEASLTTIIVGTGVLAIVAAQQAYHQKNDWAQRTGTAMLLANEIREMTLSLPLHDPITGKQNFGPEPNETSVLQYDDLDDFAGVPTAGGVYPGTVFSPPINALRMPVPHMERWSQHIMVENVLPDYISAAFAQPMGTTDTMRVTVNIRYQGNMDAQPETVATLTWVVTP